MQEQNKELVIHDSCVYARYEGMIEQPRNLLTNAGVTAKEPELTGRSTYCCGGPIESLFPSKAHEIAESRVSQLKENGENIVTMCPICLVNLRKAAGESCHISDISNTLADAYLSQTLSR
jgi:Fe-S oxidoreductase